MDYEEFKVKCIKECYSELTEEKIYLVIENYGDMYKVINNFNEARYYAADRFELIDEYYKE